MKLTSVTGILILLFFAKIARAQNSNQVEKIIFAADTIRLDSNSILPNSFQLIYENRALPDSAYELDFVKAILILKKPDDYKTLLVRYRTIPSLYEKPVRNEEFFSMIDKSSGERAVFRASQGSREEKNTGYSSLYKNGSISRGISVGNAQNLGVNTNFDLQLSGNLTSQVRIEAALTDDNIPIQPEGNTALIQDFDRIYIKLIAPGNEITLGDYLVTNNEEDYFLKVYKKAQGIAYEYSKVSGDTGSFKAGARASLARGQFARNNFNGREGVQGPYTLTGNNNEQFIIIVAGTERVFLNGKQLKRGDDQDYVIDYNTGEITFTPKILLTSFDRITVEFQYADRNYQRSILHGYSNWTGEKASFYVNVYGEQDNKNQPLFQELSDEDLRVLSEVGDSLENAVVSGVEPTDFEENRILYKRIDSLGFSEVLVYSTNPENQLYTASFSFVGKGNGNYIQDQNLANGRVYRWVAPINGVPSGDYEAVKVLVAAKAQQMVSAGGSVVFAKNQEIKYEVAASRFDQNTFSTKDSEDDIGYAAKVELNQLFNVKKVEKNKGWYTGMKNFVEYRNEDFNPIERYRTVEFERTWNRSLQNPAYSNSNEREIWYKNTLYIGKGSKRQAQRFSTPLGINNTFELYNQRGVREGFINSTGLSLSNDNWENTGNFSFSTVSYEPGEKALFNEQDLSIARKISNYKLGTQIRREFNDLRDFGGRDSSSYQFTESNSFIEYSDSGSLSARIDYSRRWDERPDSQNKFSPFLRGNIYGLELQWQKDYRNYLRWNASFRDIMYSNENRENTQSVVNRIEFNYGFLKDLIRTNTYYQVLSGRERVTNIQYIEVRVEGSGNYIWRDFNENGVRELDEFFEAQAYNQNEANYIKVFTPGNTFVRALNTEFNENLTIDFSALKKGSGLINSISKLSWETVYRLKRNVIDDGSAAAYLPVQISIDDSLLLSSSNLLRNTFYFQRNHPVFSFDIGRTDNRNKRILNLGFDARSENIYLYRARYIIDRVFTINPVFNHGALQYSSDFFSSKNYNINQEEYALNLSWQPGTKYRLRFTYAYNEQRNAVELGSQDLFKSIIKPGLTIAVGGKGNLNADISYERISFNGEDEGQVAFEMLQGLEPGDNYIWNLSANYALSNGIQLNFTYTGRKSNDNRTVHIGNFTARYVF